MRALWLLATCFAIPLMAAPAAAPQTRDDACNAGINCDCANIKDAGLLTGPWRDDCRKCEGRIIAACREELAKTQDPLRAIEEAVRKAGYCDPHCTARGPNPRPVQEAQRPRRSQSEPPLPEWAKQMQLLCGQGQKLDIDTMGGIEAAGCLNANGKRHGLWILRDTRRGVIVEVTYDNGREVSRRERKA